MRDAMAKQPDDLVLRILKDIQSTLADHGRQFEEVRQRLDEIHEGMITGLGLASHAHVRTDGIKKEIEDLKKRIKRLEAKV
jgi:uncharacterized coiled-coil DUF342 family protein